MNLNHLMTKSKNPFTTLLANPSAAFAPFFAISIPPLSFFPAHPVNLPNFSPLHFVNLLKPFDTDADILFQFFPMYPPTLSPIAPPTKPPTGPPNTVPIAAPTPVPIPLPIPSFLLSCASVTFAS